MRSIIPFFENTKDNSHCFQACLKMVLKFYFPGKNYSYRLLDKITNHKKGMWTWQGEALLFLSKIGFEIVNIENLDYKRFATRGETYLKSIWSKEIFDLQDKYSNLKREQQIARKLIKNKNISIINKETNIRDMEDYFKKDFLLIVSVNPCVFSGEKCYWSHSVVITEIGQKYIKFHDPGLPGIENRRVNRKLFIKAMSKPWKEDTNLIALKLNIKNPKKIHL